jgi:FkbM family methyltransferase
MWSDRAGELLSRTLRSPQLISGLTPLSFNPLVDWIMKDAPATIRARLNDGNFMEVDPRDYHGRILHLFGTNDPKVEKTALALLRPGDTFLDIGANYSSIGLAASGAVGKAGQVHLFEPQRAICERVQAAIEAGGYENVRLHRIGLSDHDATLTLRAPETHSGRATFEERQGPDEFPITEECVVREISNYVGPLINGPFGAKLDIEGGEPRVMPWLASHPHLTFIIFEACNHRDDLLRIVTDNGLKLFGLRRHPFLLKLEPAPDLPTMGKFHDMVAVRDLGLIGANPRLFDHGRKTGVGIREV